VSARRGEEAALQIVPYRASWPTEFAAIAAPLRQALGGLATRIDHIGSTSVPGLAAKDIVDVQVSVEALEGRIASALATLGYTLRADITGDHVPPGASSAPSEWAKQYFTPPEGQRPTHLHVRVDGRANQRYPLLFRDYLRAHPDSAVAYARLKMQLAALLRENRFTYTDIKDSACDLIAFAAEEWATSTVWRPDPSDA
jgi:GrpB-like predicted nucleotidyltransferase (UPF0157 family)